MRFGKAASILVAASTFGATALASDLPRPMSPPPAAMLPAKAPGVLPFNWGGFYGGLNLGGGFGDVSGIVFGGQLGHNWQMGQIVFGVETDLQFSDQDSTSTLVFGGTALADKQELEWFGTLRGRLGYIVFDRWLPYFTGGLAYGGRSASGTATGVLTGGYSASDTVIGWTIGVGLEYMFAPQWTARIEYLHVELDGFNANYALTGGTLPVAYGSLSNDIVRGAVNYRFFVW
jgi:outer membrane immunogenic protein